MKQTGMIRDTCLCVACLGIVLAMTSCSKGSDDAKNVGVENPTGVVAIAEAPRELTKVERLEVECRRLVTEPDWKWKGREALLAICDLCKEIRELPKEDALPLLDRWMEMAIEKPVTSAKNKTKEKSPERFFKIVFFSFLTSQGMRTDAFNHWEKIFRFFAKYTDEITAVEKRIKQRGFPQTSRSYIYLHDLQVDVKNWVYMITTVYRDVLLDRGLTEAQKADILRRFTAVEKYTVPPPDSPYGKKR